MKVSIFGLGYVGAVSAACFAKAGHKVVGVDVVDYKVAAINNGESPIEEKGLKQLIKEQVKKGNLKATKDSYEAILTTDISFICVGTPPKENGDLDLTILEKVCAEIGGILKEKNGHIVVIRSTMFPGSLDNLKKILEENSGKKMGEGFYLAVNPEFLREGSAISDFFSPPYIVIGTVSKEIHKKIFEVYKGIKTKKFLVKPDVAQMIKYSNNSWHALKVTFANEIGAICKEKGIDSKNLMNLFTQDEDLNLSSYYLMPGFAYGGSCLPKDTAALKNEATKLGLKTPLINSIPESNFSHIRRAIALIESKKKKRVGILGLTFKADTDDIRGNPVLLVINSLQNKGYDIKIFDSLIDESDVQLINESYRKEVFDLITRENLKEKVGSISSLFTDINSVLSQDTIVVSNRDESVKSHLEKLPKDKIIIDLQNMFNKSDFDAEYDHL